MTDDVAKSMIRAARYVISGENLTQETRVQSVTDGVAKSKIPASPYCKAAIARAAACGRELSSATRLRIVCRYNTTSLCVYKTSTGTLYCCLRLVDAV